MADMEENESRSDKLMPIGSPMTEIRKDDVTTDPDGVAPVEYTEDSAATLVWNNYLRAKNYVENNTWLLEWQEADILYQSPIPNRSQRVENGRPARVPRFLVAKMTRVLARAMKRGLFAEQYPFMLRPGSESDQQMVDAWTYLIGVLLKRMKLAYHGKLQIDCQVLQGTGIGKYGFEQRTRTIYTRKRKKNPENVELPSGHSKEIPTKASDEFEEVKTTITESVPFYEYRRLGTTLFSPNWSTPDDPDESAGYCVDIDYPNFSDLARMRQLSCYQKTAKSNGIPSDEVLKQFFFTNGSASAPAASQIADAMTAQGSMVTHAEGENRQNSESPLDQTLMLIEQWDAETVITILCYQGRKLTIRNEEHKQGSMSHTSCTWWPIDNCGYGMGIGRLIGPDQRVNQGVLNEALKMVAYPMNAPIVYDKRGDNEPTQNVISRLGGFWAVDPGPSGDVNKAVGFLKTPEVPADAWRFIESTQRGAEELSGADTQVQQGNVSGRQGATRSSFGAQRVAAMSDQNIADPVDSFAEGVIVPVVNFLIRMIKTKMPIAEIRRILSRKYSEEIIKAIDLDQFLQEEFEVSVLAGQKLAARAGIQQLIPFFMQLAQQPQLLEYLHQRGETIDFKTIMDLLMQVGELQQQPDIFRMLTAKELELIQKLNPGMQRVQGAIAVEQQRGKNDLDKVKTKGEVDLANNAAKIAMEHEAGDPLAHATGIFERGADKNILQNGLPDQMEQ